MEELNQRFYVDINSGIGRMSFRNDGFPYKVSDLLTDMQYYRIHAAAVFSNVSRDYSYIKGNMELMEQIKASRRLYGIAVVVPSIEYELEEGYLYYDRLLENGIKGFKLYPTTLCHEFNPFYLEALAGYMSKKRIPLMINVEETNWSDIEAVVKAFPELNIILCNTSWGTNRSLFPLMGKYQNLYFDLSSNQAFEILDICKKHFGLERILFGTSYPYKSMGGIKALIEYSYLSEDEKDQVSYKNAARLLDVKGLQPYEQNECKLDEIAARMDNGLPLDNITVIDAHTHLVDKEHIVVSNFPMIHGDEDHMIKKMDLLGIDKMMICPWEGLATDGISANETSLAAKRKYNERIEVYAMCNPNYPEDLSSILMYHEDHGFIGLKPYFYYNKYDLLGEKYNEWFEYGNKNSLIALIHSGMEGIAEKTRRLSEKYSNMAFLLAHSGASYETAAENIAVAKKRPNVFLEITYTSITNNIIEYMVSEIGSERILFGTDMPMRDPAPQLAWVGYARISVEDKKNILGGNINRLISRCYKPGPAAGG